MSATDELRRLLDERGVEYSREGCETFFKNIHIWAINNKKLCISISGLTPEQAIEATLGRGECEIETTENWLPAERYHRCKHCGAFFAVMNASGDIQPCVCPNCGRAVKR